MLRVGFDFYDTVSAHPKAYRKLASAVLESGGSVFVISAIEAGKEKKLLVDIRRTHLPYTSVHPVLYSHFSEIPKLKRSVIASLHLDFYIDDMGSTISALSGLPVIGLLGK